MVTHLLSAWETPVEALGPTARFSVRVPAETTCLGRKTPYRCMRHAAAAYSNPRRRFKDTTMEETSQAEVIGMDAHSRKVSLCLMRRTGGGIVKAATIHTTLDALEPTYERHMPRGALTVLEASTNSVSIVRRLGALGFEARQLCPDVLCGMARRDRINDRIDAENLAVAWLERGPGLRTVFTPSPRGSDMRETFFAYRDARKDATRAANRIWSFCSRHGLDVERRIGERRCAEPLEEGRARGWSAPVMERAEGLVADWRRAAGICRARGKAIAREVFADPAMTRPRQAPGIRCIGARALLAFVEDVRRFGNPKKLVSFIGLNPSVCSSGETAGRRHVSRFGRSDLKGIFIEAAQPAMRTDCPLSKWAKHLLAGGKEWNVAVAALARKLAVLCWHILMGHPAPSCEREDAAARKFVRLAHEVGKEAVRAAGFDSAAEYAAAKCSMLYGHLKNATNTEVLLC